MAFKKCFASVLVVISIFVARTSAAQEASETKSTSYWIEAETGPVWQSRNEVQVPADSGTRFSISSFGRGPALAGRIYIGYRLNSRHEIRALYAPLTLNSTGTFDSPVTFTDKTFASGVSTDAQYTFNSYRLTYRYVFLDDDVWTVRVGFTAKIRDAKIQLTQGSQTGVTSNVGFVPLLHVSAVYRLNPQYRFNVDVDALAAPQGRAEDVALFASYRQNAHWEYRLGYRTIEGGAAGGGGVYAFAWLHYGTAGVQYDF